jgi:hypothetical protein
LPQGEARESKPLSIDGAVAAPSPRIVSAVDRHVVPTMAKYQNGTAIRAYRNSKGESMKLNDPKPPEDDEVDGETHDDGTGFDDDTGYSD